LALDPGEVDPAAGGVGEGAVRSMRHIFWSGRSASWGAYANPARVRSPMSMSLSEAVSVTIISGRLPPSRS
jgi:hypothetical protein